MKSVGEVMAIGRTFKEALQKGIRGLEIKRSGFEGIKYKDKDELDLKLRVPGADRLFFIYTALKEGYSIDKLY